MRIRLLLPAGLAAAAFVVAAPLALAANQSVVAKPDNTFSPLRVAVKPGETVTFTNQGGEHNVVWNDGTPAQPADAVDPSQWPASGVSRTFTRSGAFRYYCALHGDRTSDFGMHGYVYVNSAGIVPPVVSGLTASATRTAVRLRFRSTRAGQATATFLRRSGRRFVRTGSTRFAARLGLNSRRIVRAQRRGSYRVELFVTDANRLRSDKRTRSFTVR